MTVVLSALRNQEQETGLENISIFSFLSISSSWRSIVQSTCYRSLQIRLVNHIHVAFILIARMTAQLNYCETWLELKNDEAFVFVGSFHHPTSRSIRRKSIFKRKDYNHSCYPSLYFRKWRHRKNLVCLCHRSSPARGNCWTIRFCLT